MMLEAVVTLPIEQAAINLAAAVALSSVIGFERQWHNRLAGLRTNTLVALGAATFVVFSDIVPGEGRSDPHSGASGFRYRLSWSRADFSRRIERSRSEHGCHAMVFGRSGRSCWRRLSGGRRCSNIFCRVHKSSAASDCPDHQSAASEYHRARGTLPNLRHLS